MDSIASGYVTAYGPGLISGVSGEPSQFTISTKGAGSGGLSMAVEGPSKAEVSFLQLEIILVLGNKFIYVARNIVLKNKIVPVSRSLRHSLSTLSVDRYEKQKHFDT